MKREHTTGALVFALLVVFIGLVSINESLFGKSAASAFIPTGEISLEIESATLAEEATKHLIQDVIDNPRRVTPLPPEIIDAETLWLARVIYSETKRPEEMELVAWVVRNRVETQYRGKSSYRSTVLDPFQFSAFNPGDRKRAHYSSLTPTSSARGFDNALRIAYSVRHADEAYRPFSTKTRHFYSEQSMVGQRHPNWASTGRLVRPDRPFAVEARRFRFFENVF
jgi:hypothetical protein